MVITSLVPCTFVHIPAFYFPFLRLCAVQTCSSSHRPPQHVTGIYTKDRTDPLLPSRKPRMIPSTPSSSGSLFDASPLPKPLGDASSNKCTFDHRPLKVPSNNPNVIPHCPITTPFAFTIMFALLHNFPPVLRISAPMTCMKSTGIFVHCERTSQQRRKDGSVPKPTLLERYFHRPLDPIFDDVDIVTYHSRFACSKTPPQYATERWLEAPWDDSSNTLYVYRRRSTTEVSNILLSSIVLPSASFALRNKKRNANFP